MKGLIAYICYIEIDKDACPPIFKIIDCVVCSLYDHI